MKKNSIDRLNELLTFCLTRIKLCLQNKLALLTKQVNPEFWDKVQASRLYDLIWSIGALSRFDHALYRFESAIGWNRQIHHLHFTYRLRYVTS